MQCYEVAQPPPRRALARTASQKISLHFTERCPTATGRAWPNQRRAGPFAWMFSPVVQGNAAAPIASG